MSSEQQKEVLEVLVEFVKRVASDKKASPAEIATLPEIARLLVETISLNVI